MQGDDTASDRTAIDAPIEKARRPLVAGALAVFVALQVAIPLRYYLGDDLYDERFAWRMFSRVRVQECTAEASEDGRRLTVLGQGPADPGILPAPWQSLLTRNRPAVIRRFLTWRCQTAPDGPPGHVRVTTSCRDTEGTTLPPIVREIDCASGEITEDRGGDE
jgi:hypothetical protein